MKKLLSLQNRMRKRKGAVAVEYIVVFPMFVFLMALMIMFLMMVLNIMKYNDIATNIANNANFSTTNSVGSGSGVCSNAGGSGQIANQCSQFVDGYYSNDYLFKSPYATDIEISTTSYKNSGDLGVAAGNLMYVEVHYTVLGFDFKSVGMSVIF